MAAVRSELAVALAVLALALACADAYTYRCLTDATRNKDIRQYELVRFRDKMPSCSGRLRYCSYALLLYPNRNILSSEVLVLTADSSDCVRELAHITRAVGRMDTDITYQKLETRCQDLPTIQITGWFQKEYTFRALVQCIDNLCTDTSTLEFWMLEQRSQCKRFLQKPVDRE